MYDVLTWTVSLCPVSFNACLCHLSVLDTHHISLLSSLSYTIHTRTPLSRHPAYSKWAVQLFTWWQRYSCDRSCKSFIFLVLTFHLPSSLTAGLKNGCWRTLERKWYLSDLWFFLVLMLEVSGTWTSCKTSISQTFYFEWEYKGWEAWSNCCWHWRQVRFLSGYAAFSVI